MLGLARTAPLADLNGAISRYMTADNEGDGFEVAEEGRVGPLRIVICRSDRNHLSRVIVNLGEHDGNC